VSPAPRYSVWTVVAPIALIGTFALAVLLVYSTLEETPAPTTSPGIVAVSDEPATIDDSVPEMYRIRKGDTLSTIAERYGVDTDAVRELNPSLDPLFLTPGERIRLRPKSEDTSK